MRGLASKRVNSSGHGRTSFDPLHRVGMRPILAEIPWWRTGAGYSRISMGAPDLNHLPGSTAERPSRRGRRIGTGSTDAVFNAGLLFDDGTYHLFARGIRAATGATRREGPRYPRLLLGHPACSNPRTACGTTSAYVLATAGVARRPRPGHWRIPAGAAGAQRRRGAGRDDVHAPARWTTTTRGGSGAHRLELRGTGPALPLDDQRARLIGPDGIGEQGRGDLQPRRRRAGDAAPRFTQHPGGRPSTRWTQPARPGRRYWDAHLEELEHHTIITPAPGAYAVGAGAPPVLTPDGFILFFHERRADGATP